MSIETRRPDKSDGTTDEEPLTMAELENALHQRAAVTECPDCGAEMALDRDSLYYVDHIARLACDVCYFEDLLPHSWLQNNLSLPDDLEVEQ
jgi:hypothetical protein